jgi:MFS family permease
VRREPLLVLALATAVGSAGLAAGGTAGALLGAELADTEAAAGLPLGLLVVGQAAAAILISRRTARVGRSRGLALGYVLGTAGAALVVFADHNIGVRPPGSLSSSGSFDEWVSGSSKATRDDSRLARKEA